MAAGCPRLGFLRCRLGWDRRASLGFLRCRLGWVRLAPLCLGFLPSMASDGGRDHLPGFLRRRPRTACRACPTAPPPSDRLPAVLYLEPSPGPVRSPPAPRTVSGNG